MVTITQNRPKEKEKKKNILNFGHITRSYYNTVHKRKHTVNQTRQVNLALLFAFFFFFSFSLLITLCAVVSFVFAIHFDLLFLSFFSLSFSVCFMCVRSAVTHCFLSLIFIVIIVAFFFSCVCSLRANHSLYIHIFRTVFVVACKEREKRQHALEKVTNIFKTWHQTMPSPFPCLYSSFWLCVGIWFSMCM